MTRHDRLHTALKGISVGDRIALAWSILEDKSERTITKAIALSANRTAGHRVARVEFHDRIDLAFLAGNAPVALYEAKAAYLSDFREKRIANPKDKWLGDLVKDDLAKLRSLRTKYRSVKMGALFYLYEVRDPSRQQKYRPPRNAKWASAAQATKEVQRRVGARCVACWPVDCEVADGTHVKVHVLVFDA